MSSRKRNALSLDEKLKILKEVDESSFMSKVDIAKKLKIPVSTLKTLIYKRQEIEDNASKCGKSGSKKLRVQSGKFSDIDEIVLQFFKQCRAANIPVSGPMLMSKAKEIRDKMQVSEEECSFSAGWLHKFKLRHGISCQMLSGDSKSVPLETVEEWFESLSDRIAGYEEKNIFNCDETGLFYHLLPTRTLEMKGEPCHGVKKSKDRLTLLLCTNSDGSEKLTPFVIGKYKKPRCFKNIKTLPLPYEANKKAWMTGSLFTDWLKKLDKKMTLEKRKILLFMDQCPSHPPDTGFLKNVEVIFFPANCTSHVQPLDLGIIKNFKCHYRQKLVQLMLDNLTFGTECKAKKLDVLQAMNIISFAWSQVKADCIQHCFRKAGFDFNLPVIDPTVSENTDAVCVSEWDNLDCQYTFEEYINCDEDLGTSNVLTVDELINSTGKETESSSSDDDNEDHQHLRKLFPI